MSRSNGSKGAGWGALAPTWALINRHADRGSGRSALPVSYRDLNSSITFLSALAGFCAASRFSRLRALAAGFARAFRFDRLGDFLDHFRDGVGRLPGHAACADCGAESEFSRFLRSLLAQPLVPAVIGVRRLAVLRVVYEHPRHGVRDPVEIRLGNRPDVGVGGRVGEIDCIRDTVFDRELDSVQIISQRLVDKDSVANDAVL